MSRTRRMLRRITQSTIGKRLTSLLRMGGCSVPKRGLGIDVLTAARERIAWTFESFEQVYLSFSGGKDSTVMLHLAADYARKNNRRLGVLFVDLEGQYRLTIDHVRACLDEYADVIEPYWICLPVHLRNAVSVFETHWMCWDPEKREAWIREPPEDAVIDPEALSFFWPGMEFEEFVPAFGEWYAGDSKTACMVGIRADESLNRYRTVASQTKAMVENRRWTTEVTEHVTNVYP